MIKALEDVVWCKICGGEIYPESESVNGSHADSGYCVVILNARVDYETNRADALEARAKQISNLTAIATSNGNWNYDPYLHGMANAMLLAYSIMENLNYEPLNAPDEWLADRNRPISQLPSVE